MKHRICAKIHATSEDEMRKMLDNEIISEIKSQDQTAKIHVFAIAHEGEADAKHIGRGRRIFKFFRDAIFKLHDRVKIGTAVFNRHSETNTHEGREVIGRVVGKSLKEIGGKLFSLAAIYINPKNREKPFDVASIEADIAFLEEGEAVRVDSVESVTGIALSNSAIEKPGFPGATLLGAMAAFKNPKGDLGQMEITLEDVQDFISSKKIKPSQLFDEESLGSDKIVKSLINDETNDSRGFGRRKAREIEELKEKHSKAEESWKKEKIELLKAANTAKVGPGFDELAKDLKLGEKTKAFVKTKLKDFSSDEVEEKAFNKSLKEFVTGQVEEFKGIAVVMGIDITKDVPKEEQKQEQKQESGNNNPVNLPPGEQNQPSNNYADPKSNPFIPA